MRRNYLLHEAAVRGGDTKSTHLLIGALITAALISTSAASLIYWFTGTLICGLRGGLIPLVDFLKGASERVTGTDGAARVRVRDVLSVAADGKHEQHHEELHEVPDHDAEEEIREIVVAREQHDVLGDDADNGRNALAELHRDNVTIVDVRKFVREDALEFVPVEQLDEFARDDDSPVAAAADRERVRHAHVRDLQVRLLQVLLAADLLDELVDLGVLLFIHRFGADAPERGPLPDLVLDADEQDAADDDECQDALALAEEEPRCSDGDRVEREEGGADDGHPYLESDMSHTEWFVAEV